MKLTLKKKPEEEAPEKAAAVAGKEPGEDSGGEGLSKKELKKLAKQEAKERKAAEKLAKKKSKEKKTAPGGGLKGFFVHHVEKIVLVAFLVVCGLLIYFALGRETLDEGRTPEDLARQVEQINSSIQNSRPSPIQVSTYSQLAARGAGNLKLDLLRWNVPLNAEIAPALVKREKPEVYPVEALLVRAGTGVFYTKQKSTPDWAKPRESEKKGQQRTEGLPPKFKLEGVRLPRREPAKDARGLPIKKDTGPTPFVSGRAWASILGKIPTVAQQAEYDRKFMHAHGHKPAIDRPNYIALEVQRVELGPEENVSEATWQREDVKVWREIHFVRRQGGANQVVHRSDVLDPQRATWLLTAPEVADSWQVHPLLTQPLGPLVFQSWEPWAVHPDLRPEEPEEITVEEVVPLDEEGVKGTTEEGKADDQVEDLFGFGAQPKKEEKKEVNESQDSDTEKKVVQRVRKVRRQAPSKPPEHRLLRVFDFSVEPGKRYAYRLRLYLRNPNHADFQHPKNLADASLKDEFALITDWSEAREPVVIPGADHGFARGIKYGRGRSPDEATIIIKGMDLASGALQYAEMTGRRGQVASGTAEVLDVNAIGKRVTQSIGWTFSSELILVDFRSGAELPYQKESADEEKETEPYFAPAEVLFADSKGNLMISGEGPEVAKYDQLKEQFKEKPATETPENPLFGGRKAGDGKFDPSILIPPSPEPDRGRSGRKKQ